ncbi:LysR family transcriptional regulator [Caballeronia udeis]|uniref:LysR family transcriptional regulator n=2 Tax=Caballeronia udeis TaxID=1232866 RepID=A0A158FW57_9BURK|nr:LysR family transcriptional regulator [Caballeronia udeis]
MRNRVTLKSVQAFEAAARLSSFALAADELFVTPSAISHQIKLLEEQLSIRLFHRLHRAVILTDSGRQYAEEISSAFARIDSATREIGRVAKSDILTIHCTPSFATQWLMPRIARFSAAHPDIDVRLNASSEAANLISEAVDIDIRYGPRKLQPAGTMVLELPPETIVPLCAPALMEGDYPLRSVADLQHHTLIHSEGCLVGWRDWMRLHRKTRVDIVRGPRFDRSFMALSAAVDGLGVCLESLLLAQRELETGRLVAPFGFDGLGVHGYTLNLLKSRADLPKLRSFQDWLFAELDK